MIVGNGMIAKSLTGKSGLKNDILFCSGVSDSKNTTISEFDKEEQLLFSHLNNLKNNETLIYFSTTSIFDPAKVNSPYTIHKLKMEQLIRSKTKNHIIIRLPNAVGKSSKANTLVDFFYWKILNSESFELQTNAIRHLIDVEIISELISDIKWLFGKKDVTVNILTTYPVSCAFIVEQLEIITGKKAIFTKRELPVPSTTPIPEEEAVINWNMDESKLKQLLRKYYDQEGNRE